MSDPRDQIEQAFRAVRAELGIRSGFPAEVLRAAEGAAAAGPASVERLDLRELPFVTIDPPGSRDLDQALHIGRAAGGYRVRYAIADVAAFVERGGVVEGEAWLRGVTYYAPDQREPLYPEALSQGAASLLAGEERPAVVFDLELDARGEPSGVRIGRARVRSRAQLTYRQVSDHVAGEARLDGEAYAETLDLLREVGELRLARERERGGVSLPIRPQHVQQRAALRLGYELLYEEPSPAEEWNAQISLLTGHVAALRMLRARVGVLRVVPPVDPREVERFRVAALALGFHWPEGLGYAGFMHGLDLAHPHLDVLVWQARRVTRGSDYVAFAGEPPEHAEHAALAMPYAHCTAPLRRLADRYVLDLLVELEGGGRPDEGERDTLLRLPGVMNEADTRASRLQRRVVDIAEAWTLRERVGETFRARVMDVRHDGYDVQLTEPPVRARAARDGAAPDPRPGDPIEVRLEGVDAPAGRVELRRVAAAGA